MPGGARSPALPGTSSAAMMIAAMPSTVISPSVSKPRKSTMMTLTAFAPPPSGTELARKYEAIESKGRVITMKASAAVPRPAAPATHTCSTSRGALRLARTRRRQPVQRQHHQHDRHEFDEHLRERQIRRRQVDEHPRHDQPYCAEEQQRHQAAPVRDRRRDREDGSHQQDRRRDRPGRRQRRHRTDRATAQERQRAGDQGHQHQHQQVPLQAAVLQRERQRARRPDAALDDEQERLPAAARQQ